MVNKITFNIKSKEDSDGLTYTRVSTYNNHLADIYFLEEREGYRYCIDYGYGSWDIEHYENEIDAVKRIARHYGFNGSHKQVFVKMGYYCNSEIGAIHMSDIDNVNILM